MKTKLILIVFLFFDCTYLDQKNDIIDLMQANNCNNNYQLLTEGFYYATYVSKIPGYEDSKEFNTIMLFRDGTIRVSLNAQYDIENDNLNYLENNGIVSLEESLEKIEKYFSKPRKEKKKDISRFGYYTLENKKISLAFYECLPGSFGFFPVPWLYYDLIIREGYILDDSSFVIKNGIHPFFPNKDEKYVFRKVGTKPDSTNFLHHSKMFKSKLYPSCFLGWPYLR